jgi:hypothetical protein
MNGSAAGARNVMAMHGTLPVAREPFAGLVPLGPDYAVEPVEQAFNWSECLATVERGEWFVVAFRSVRKLDADEALLDELDRRALAEAVGHSGLLHYFRGEMDGERRCLSMCVWEDRTRAREAAALPKHTDAIAIAGASYTSYVLERYRLTKVDGSVDLVPIEPPQRSDAVNGASA